MNIIRIRRPSAPRTQRGVSLIEVLIAVVVLAFGLLGIAAMQLTALRNSQSSMQRSQAIAQTYAMLDAMRANAPRAIIGDYNIPETCALPDAGDVVANDLRHWISTIKADDMLGADACGEITCTAIECSVTITWDDSKARKQAASANTRAEVTTVTQL